MVTFIARRREPELVAPARPTPREIKYLSDIDNQISLRFYATGVEFFENQQQPAGGGELSSRRDPVAAIRSALAEALVYMYPVAGRLKELTPDGRLVVECTAEGVVFVEADVDVRLAELGVPLQPPYPCVDEFLCNLEDTKAVVDKPLVYIQVTRFSCGGYAVGTHACHTMMDAYGIVILLKTIGDLARGEPRPAVLPVWEREILTSHGQQPPRNTTRPHLAYEPLGGDDVMLTTPAADMVGQYFLFGPAEISALRRHVASRCTVFELLSAAVWLCRTAALGYAPDQRVRFMFTSTARGGWKRDPPIPRGYYGVAMVLLVAETTAGQLCGNGLAYAVELVSRAKFQTDDEYMRTLVELLPSRKWAVPLALDRTYCASDITASGEDAIDFGIGRRVGGGVPMAADIMNTLLSYLYKCKNANGDDCIVVPMYLPKPAMERFAALISGWINNSERAERHPRL